MTIERWDPFDEMLTLRDAMNRLIEESFVQPTMTFSRVMGRTGMPIDLREKGDQYILEAALPGMRPEDIEVTVQGNQVHIQAEMKHEEERREERYHLRERRIGRFQRSLSLPDNIQSDQISCQFQNGVLTLTLPKTEEARPRRIPVSGGEQHPMDLPMQEQAVGQPGQQGQQGQQGG